MDKEGDLKIVYTRKKLEKFRIYEIYEAHIDSITGDILWIGKGHAYGFNEYDALKYYLYKDDDYDFDSRHIIFPQESNK